MMIIIAWQSEPLEPKENAAGNVARWASRIRYQARASLHDDSVWQTTEHHYLNDVI